jgi:hypothetical protein
MLGCFQINLSVVVLNAFLNASSLHQQELSGLIFSIAFFKRCCKTNSVVKQLRCNLFPFYRLRQYQDHTTLYILNLHSEYLYNAG